MMDTSLTDVTWLSGAECAQFNHLPNQHITRSKGIDPAIRFCGNENVRPKSTSSSPKRPVMTYSNLIMEALKANQVMTQFQICQWVSRHYPYYDIEDRSWQRAIKQSLRRNSMFISNSEIYNKTDNNPLWMLAECYQNNINEGVPIIAQTQPIEKKNYKQTSNSRLRESKQRKTLHAPIMIDPIKKEVLCNQQRVSMHAFAEALYQNPLVEKKFFPQNNKCKILSKQSSTNDHSYSIVNNTQNNLQMSNKSSLETDSNNFVSSMEVLFQNENSSREDENTMGKSNDLNCFTDSTTHLNTIFSHTTSTNNVNKISTYTCLDYETNNKQPTQHLIKNPLTKTTVYTNNEIDNLTQVEDHNLSIPLPSIEQLLTNPFTEYSNSNPHLTSTSTPRVTYNNDNTIDWKQFLATPTIDKQWNTADNLFIKSPNQTNDDITITPKRKSTLRRSLSLDGSF